MSLLTQTLLSQVSDRLSTSDKVNMTETRGNHAIAAGINMIAMIKENYSNEESEILIKRFLNAIRTNDPKKFNRGIQNIRESIEIKKENTTNV